MTSRPDLLGNQYVRLWDRHARPRKFEDADELWANCVEYFKWVEGTPFQEPRLVSYEGVSTIEYLPRMRPFTLGGLCVFLGMCDQTWYDLRKREEGGWSAVALEVDAIIRDQKFSGAASGFFNANIISRDLGLTDRQEVNAAITVNIPDEDAGL